MKFSLLINMKMPTIVGIFILAEKFSCSAMFNKKEFGIVSYLRFVSMKNFMLSRVEHYFITSRPGGCGFLKLSKAALLLVAQCRKH